jgi:alpha-beta hydrolase superfamily lysophospholipase
LSLISMTTASDGTQLAGHRWAMPDGAAPEGRPAYLLHGLGEHAGRYDAQAQWLGERGWQLAAHDHRGHGKSSGKRGALRDVDDLVLDAEHRLSEYVQETGVPPLLIGVSLGGLVAARVALRGNVELAGMVLVSPAFAFKPTAVQRLMLGTIGNLAPDLRVGNGIDAARLSHEQAVVDAYRNDPLVHDRVTGRLVRFVMTAGDAAITQASALPCRTLMLVAGEDSVVDPAGSRRFADGAAPGKLALRWYHQAFHEVLNESPELAAPVYADLDEWLATLDPPTPVEALAGIGLS